MDDRRDGADEIQRGEGDAVMTQCAKEEEALKLS